MEEGRCPPPHGRLNSFRTGCGSAVGVVRVSTLDDEDIHACVHVKFKYCIHVCIRVCIYMYI